MQKNDVFNIVHPHPGLKKVEFSDKTLWPLFQVQETAKRLINVCDIIKI